MPGASRLGDKFLQRRKGGFVRCRETGKFRAKINSAPTPFPRNHFTVGKLRLVETTNHLRGLEQDLASSGYKRRVRGVA